MPGPATAPGSAYRVQREDDLDLLSTEYADLHAASDAGAFQHGVWLHRLYSSLAPRRDARRLVVTIRRADDGLLVGALPLVARGRVLRELTFADLGVADYAAPVLRRDAAADLLADPAVVRGVRRALGRFDVLRVDRVADDAGPLLGLLPGARPHRHLYDTHLIDLGESHEEWRAGLDPSFVRHLERKYKRLRPKGERVLRLVEDEAEVEPVMARLREFRAARFADRRGVDLMQDDDCFAFYCQVARDGIRAGGPTRLWVLEVGGEPAAITLDLVEPDRELYLLVGYDVGRLRNYSLGLLIVDELARSARERGLRHLDLTVGDESYKADFGARPRPLFQVRAARTLRGRAAIVGQDAYLAARARAKQVLADREARRTARGEDADGGPDGGASAGGPVPPAAPSAADTRAAAHSPA